MNKKRLLSVLFVSTLAFGSMSAQTSMVAYGEDGKYWTFDINKVEKVTFENKSLVFYTTQRNAIDLTKIQSIKFVDQATAIKPQVSTLGGTLSLLRRGNIVSVKGWDSSKTATVAIYNANGQIVDQRKGWNGADIDLSNLGRGVYILKVNNKTLKLTL